jgi:LAS superfamily LD-carboxypeptidase LdcB
MTQSIRFSAEELTGLARSHIVELRDPPCSLHHAVVEPFLAMRSAALAANIELTPVSSFRDLARQLSIWNGKCRGERPLLGVDGLLLDAGAMSEDERVTAILQWSALPGTSRHHWGTDMDVIDTAALPLGEVAQLVPEEYAPGAVFSRLNDWLAGNAARFGFYRPYLEYRGGFQAEPWHLSYAPVARAAEQQFSPEMLWAVLEKVSLDAAASVRRRLPEIVERYVLNVVPPPAAALIAATRLA